MQDLTQKEKVILMLVRAKSNWMTVFEFQNAHGLFIGHEGAPRISEVFNDYPTIIERERVPGKKYYRYKLDISKSSEWLPKLSDYVRSIVEKDMQENCIMYQKVVREWDTTGRIAIPRDILKTFGYPQN